MSSPVLDRFLRYVTYDTQSREGSDTYPSTPTQLVLLRDLVGELRAMGIADADMDEHAFTLDRALELSERQEQDHGLGDMPYPPDYPKMPGEPKRVQPSRAKRNPKD